MNPENLKAIEETLVKMADKITQSKDTHLERRKEIEKLTGVSLDPTIMEAVIYGATTVCLAIQIGIEQDKKPKDIFMVSGILVADFIKLRNSLKK